jgi:hypothetical protein
LDLRATLRAITQEIKKLETKGKLSSTEKSRLKKFEEQFRDLSSAMAESGPKK